MALLNRSRSRTRLLPELLQVGRSITRAFGTDRSLRSSNHQQEKCVETEQTNGVRRIILNHPKTRNSLSLKMINDILQSLKAEEEEPSLRSIVISASPGKVFSAGHNLKELSSGEEEKVREEVFQKCAQLMRAISSSPVPVIAAVDGLAAAAGCQLVATCDIVICTRRSSFSTPGVNFGIFCSTPGIPLTRNVSKKLASHMLMTGLPISAEEAYKSGLVSKVVADDKLETEVKKVTDAINEKSRSVLHLGKKFIYEQKEMGIDEAYVLGTETMINNLKLRDAQEGIRSFTEKRKPIWSHKYDYD